MIQKLNFKNNKDDKKTPKIRNKKKLLMISSLLIILIIFGMFWFFSDADDTIKAQLVIDSGFVQIKHSGKDWQQAESGMLLFQSDSIRTGNNSQATVILFESSIIQLDNNTEIMLKKIIRLAEETSMNIRQKSGRTWNTILKISGIDSYEVQTPTTIASVRGTSFYVQILENGTTEVGVVYGNITIFKIIDNEIVMGINLSENEYVYIDPTKIHSPLKPLLLELDEWILQNIQKDEEFLSGIKDDLWARISPYIDELKQRFGITEEELEALIDGYLRGYYDLPPETPDWVRDIIEIT